MRTKIYIKELESEVLRLRKSEAAAVAHAEMLEHKVHALAQILHAHGIQEPSEHWDSGHREHHGSYSSERGAQDLPIRSGAEAKLGGSAQGNPSLYHSNDPSIQMLHDSGNLSVVPSLFVPSDRVPGQQVGHNADPATPFQFDDSQAELDFILTYGNNGLLVY